MEDNLIDRLRGVAVGAAVGDALGMPLEFGPRQPASALVRDMRPGRLPEGTFTDDTEMALALAESLLERFPLDPANLAQHFLGWYRQGPPDVGIHTAQVLRAVSKGVGWQEATAQTDPHSAGNGSIMRCWPVAIAYYRDADPLVEASKLQSQVTHPHPECLAACAFANLTIRHLLLAATPQEAVDGALARSAPPPGLLSAITKAPARNRDELQNSGWVRHTVESAAWGLLTTRSFEEAVVQVVNLGGDADSAGAVVGALAGAAYGLAGIPPAWRAALRGEWPLRSGAYWQTPALCGLADRLAGLQAG